MDSIKKVQRVNDLVNSLAFLNERKRFKLSVGAEKVVDSLILGFESVIAVYAASEDDEETELMVEKMTETMGKFIASF